MNLHTLINAFHVPKYNVPRTITGRVESVVHFPLLTGNCSIRSPQEMAEILVAFNRGRTSSGEVRLPRLYNIVALTPEYELDLEIFAMLIAGSRTLENHELLDARAAITEQMRLDGTYDKVIESIRDERDKIEYDISNNVPPVSSAYKDNILRVKANIEAGTYQVGSYYDFGELPVEAVARAYTIDTLHRGRSEEIIRAEILPVVEAYIDDHQWQFTTIPEEQEIIYAGVTGPGGVGKTTSVDRSKRFLAERYGDEAILMRRSDAMRDLLFEYHGLHRDEHEWAAETVGEDGKLLRGKIYGNHERSLTGGSNRRPLLRDSIHVLRDDAFFGEQRDVDARKYITILDVAPEVSVVRAYNRIKELGRAIKPEKQLGTHRDIAQDFVSVMRNCGGEKIQIYIDNNEVPKGSPPKPVAYLDLETRRLEVYEPELFVAFLRKRHLDVTAKPEKNAANATEALQGLYEQLFDEEYRNISKLSHLMTDLAKGFPEEEHNGVTVSFGRLVPERGETHIYAEIPAGSQDIVIYDVTPFEVSGDDSLLRNVLSRLKPSLASALPVSDRITSLGGESL